MESDAYFRRSKGPIHIQNKKLMIVLAIVSALIALVMLLNLMIARPLESLAEKRVSSEASRLLNDALREVMDEYSIAGGASFAVGQSTEGEGSLLFIDAVGMNLMAARVTERAQRKMAEFGSCGIEVPLGTASGVPLLNGAGPKIPIKVEPIGEVISGFSSAFEAAGVNQTRYRASLKLSASVDMLVFGRSRCVSASITAPICEAVVIGGVPAAYTNVESIEDALNLIPTEAEP